MGFCVPELAQERRTGATTIYGVQVAAIIRTLSTLSFGAADAVALLAEPLALDDDEALGSTVPEISTLWPTCGVSLLASASSR